ncbi:phage protein Gp27 family protein [Thiofaba sp. EF100]|uniref:phage protein Gp27 family protein n=1 Tax=Thiofaba sp. EF100 TaxID=3121274 RepID=UPI0032220D51
MPPRDRISQLPPEVREAIDRLLIERGFSGYDQLEKMILEAHGVAISRSAIARYGQKLQERLQDIRDSTEAALLLAKAAPDEADHRSAAVLSMLQTSLFDAMLALREAEDMEPADRVRLLAHAARAIAEASRASIGQKKWAEEVRAKLDEVERAASKAGRRLDAETLKAVREALYGS